MRSVFAVVLLALSAAPSHAERWQKLPGGVWLHVAGADHSLRYRPGKPKPAPDIQQKLLGSLHRVLGKRFDTGVTIHVEPYKVRIYSPAGDKMVIHQDRRGNTLGLEYNGRRIKPEWKAFSALMLEARPALGAAAAISDRGYDEVVFRVGDSERSVEVSWTKDGVTQEATRGYEDGKVVSHRNKTRYVGKKEIVEEVNASGRSVEVKRLDGKAGTRKFTEQTNGMSRLFTSSWEWGGVKFEHETTEITKGPAKGYHYQTKANGKVVREGVSTGPYRSKGRMRFSTPRKKNRRTRR